MATCTVFKNFAYPVENKSIILLAKDIASDKFRAPVEEIQTLLVEGKLEEAAEKKDQLLAFTPSATFKEKRLPTHIDNYSGFIHLDFDKIPGDQMEAIYSMITTIPYTFLCFRSPSGKGYKVFIEVSTGVEHHQLAYQQVTYFYEAKLGIKADPKCKDINRLCFVSYDPHLYKNISNKKFEVNVNEGLIIKSERQDAIQETEENEYSAALAECVTFTEQKKTYVEGSRNDYIYLLASNCNRKGIPKEVAVEFVLSKFNLKRKEIENCFNSAYTHHTTEFARFANLANLQTPKHDDQEKAEDYLKTTPTIPDSVFAALPQILQDGAAAFPDKRKRDVFFTGAIAILSGCLPKVTGVYFQERVYPHLFTFIIAPAGNGKGVLKNAKRLAAKYDDKIIAKSKQLQKVYEAELAEYKREVSAKGKKEPIGEKPEEPPFKILFIPANCSTSRMMEHLQQNGGSGIICETEADTMSGAKKQDWGDYSPILRAAFHGEEISLSRKLNNELIKVAEPRLAITLTGTPSQAPRLIGSSEDGLFSRFLFYAFKSDHVWQDPSPKSQTIIHNDHFEALSLQVLNMVEFLEGSSTDVQLHPHQWDILNSTFIEMLSDVTTFTSEDASGVVYRLGLILFRFCMIFTALRKFENAEVTDSIFCTDEDFDTALIIVKTYLQHSLLMFNNLPGHVEGMQFKAGDGKRRFIDALPQNFTRKEAVELGKQFNLGASTVSHLLPKLVPQYFTQPKSGSYSRV